MGNNRQLAAEQIIARISSDHAGHEVIQRLLEEMQGFRPDINRLRQEMESPARNQYLTVSEAAELFGLCEQTVRNRAKDGAWPPLALWPSDPFRIWRHRSHPEVGRAEGSATAASEVEPGVPHGAGEN